jgi:hypothetical protein
MKLTAAKDNLTKTIKSDEQIKYNIMVKKLQAKLNKFLEVSDDSDASNADEGSASGDDLLYLCRLVNYVKNFN